MINDGLEFIDNSNFFDTFPFYNDYIDKVNLGKLDEKSENIRFADIKKNITERLVIMLDERGTFRFLHQNFRDYFAAVHILNEIQSFLSNDVLLPDVIKKNTISYYVGKYIGEIEGEYSNIPILDEENKCWSAYHYSNTQLVQLLNRCKNLFDKTVGYTVWNIIEIWKNVRKELTGADLSLLDLSSINFNMVICSRFYGDKILAVNFNGSMLTEKNILPQGHNNKVISVVYRKDGNRILSTSSDNTIKEWDVVTGECVRTYKRHYIYGDILYNFLEKCALYTSDDGTISELNNIVDQSLGSYKGNSIYSPDGNRILSINGSRIVEQDLISINHERTYIGHSLQVNSAIYSPDGSCILSASNDGTIKEWDILTGNCLFTYRGHSSFVKSAIYSPYGKYFISSSSDGTIKEWEIFNDECLKTYIGHSSPVNSIVYSTTRACMLSSSDDGTIKEWDISTGQCIRTYYDHFTKVTSAIYSPNEERILSTSNTSIKEWDVHTGECLRIYQGYSSQINSAIYSPDGIHILLACADGTIKEWDILQKKIMRTYYSHSSSVNSAVYDNRCRHILSASDDGTIKEWDALTGQCIHTYIGHNSSVKMAIYSHDGKRILSTSDHKITKEWDALLKSFIRDYQGYFNIISSSVYRHDNKSILLISNGKLDEINVLTGQLIKPYETESFSLSSAVYSYNDKRILTSFEGKITEIDISSGEYKIYQASSENANYSYGNECILVSLSNGIIKELDILSGSCINIYQTHPYDVINATYSFDDRCILTTTTDNSLREWNVAAGKSTKILANVPGLIIQGCSFNQLYSESNISEKCINILKKFGAKIISIEQPKIYGQNHTEENNIMSNRRFAVALSFPGEYRNFVKKIDYALGKLLSPNKIFFDERYEEDFIGINSDTKLQRIYNEESDIVVAFLCKEYKNKEWCNNVECRVIRDKIKKGDGDRILPLRFDNTEIEGFFSIDIAPDISNRKPDDIAQLIYKFYIKNNI